MLLCMNVMNVICMLMILDKTTKRGIWEKDYVTVQTNTQQNLKQWCRRYWWWIWVACFKLFWKRHFIGNLVGDSFPDKNIVLWWYLSRKRRLLSSCLPFIGRNTHGENCWNSFCVHSSKENFAFFFKFWSKNSFKTSFFLVSKVIFTRKSVILQSRIKQELQTNGHMAQILLIEW